MKAQRIYSTPKSFIITILMVLTSICTVVAVGIWYTNREIRQSNHAWCEIVNSLDERYRALPIDAPKEAHEFARQIASLKRSYDC